MGDENKTPGATPPASSGGLTSSDVETAVNKALKPITDGIATLGQQQKILADTMAALPPAPPAPVAEKKKAEEPAAAQLTLDQVKKLLDEKLTEQQKQSAGVAEREKFITEKMNKIPVAYRGQLGTDPAKWDEQLKTIQSQYETDFKAAGGKIENLGAPTNAATGAPDPKLDPSKMSRKQFADTYLPKVPGAAVPKASAA